MIIKFESEDKGLIFLYDNDFETLEAFKLFGTFCKKINEDKLKKLLAVFSYFNGIFAWSKINDLNDKLYKASKHVQASVIQTYRCLNHLKNMQYTLLKAWATFVNSRMKKLYPTSFIRRHKILKPTIRRENVTEELIIKALEKIKNACPKDPRLVESVYKSNEFNVKTVFKVEYEILRYAKNMSKLPKNCINFTKFQFPDKEFKEQCTITLEDFKVKLKQQNKLIGELLISDISSLILNDTIKDSERQWLRINGRRMKATRSNLEAERPMAGQQPIEYINPAENFFSMSVDSFLVTKSLVELKIYVLQILDIKNVKIEKDKVKLRLKIWSEKFWASTNFVLPEVKGESLVCYFNQYCRIRVKDPLNGCIKISLYAILAEQDKILGYLESLKKEDELAFTDIAIKDIDVIHLINS